MQKITKLMDDLRRLGWLYFPVVPLGFLISEVADWSSHALNYPQYFNDKCTQFGEVYYRGAASITMLLIENAIWLSPAITLILLWNKHRIAIIYTLICLPISSFISQGVRDDLTGNVNCYKDIGLGDGIMGLALLVQTVILLACTLLAAIGFVCQLWAACRLRMQAGSTVP